MKTQIIQLERNDDYISVRDKMNWGQAGRILLVWPEEGNLIERQLELTLLKRQAKRLGAQLAIVTRSPEVRFNATRAGIRVFTDDELAIKTDWKAGHQRSTELKRNRIRFQPVNSRNSHSRKT